MNRDSRPLEALFGRICQRHTLVLIPVDDPSDRELPDIGVALFNDPEGNLVEVDTANSEGRRAYSDAWLANRHTLQGTANRLGIPLIPVSTDRDVHDALMLGMRSNAHTRVLR